MLNSKVTASGVSGILRDINYKNKTAIVEMDCQYLVEYKFNEIIINQEDKNEF